MEMKNNSYYLWDKIVRRLTLWYMVSVALVSQDIDSQRYLRIICEDW